ncbi:sugar transferase [Rhizobium sp. MC63]|uniref:Lipopolysaccharide/colanic/teichoic acid biosynthesis glycosyltransferase n=2 Tax=Rhizobium TaxID=379 RepID=A0A7W8XFW7_9HYPH|nr:MULTISPECIES: sugar transferase [Rhizobium]MBB4575081.1 lipopolysaccharide/colanic/teichoic acid biosynthesis glycosyltransferase [Rhizobium lentis]MBB5551390.1 lipopolysaccharide/colanic/teichoic acid biosynthesis glycosyltransferase [Rhizobium lentis]MBB5562114.1 lipopolysaccharide/colanic/teichoic acid biosynthesis glycosyltransferase [Rhizobium lentis]MBB5568697.1 lipopolysaccharide/colanic/teichoic acid biosynthesis glycosyltransferase [Rhizobium lentis]MDF0697694.1 sugar transferase [
MNAFTSKTNSRFDPSQRQIKIRTLVIANSNIRQPESFSNGEEKATLRLAVKRLIDIVISANALLVLAPLFLAIALFIKLDDGGPVFFRQIRWGLNGRKINVFKFRSMRAEVCDPSGVQQTVKGDARMTGIGAMLRRTNIDELPQLLNVLKGEMSLVGPRCHAINMRAAGRLYEEVVPNYHHRHIMRPGITGLAQTRGWRGPTTRPLEARARIACDIYYVRNFSLLLDLKILFKTLIIELRGGTGF